jgi:hypothetical protein
MKTKNKKIKLSKIEQSICKVLAQKRHDNNRKNNVNNSKIGDQSDFETDLEGIAAEFAFCKIHNIFPDLSIHVRSSKSGTDKKGDCVYNGYSIDVKTTKYKTGKLLAVTWKDSDSVDIYALMVGSFPNYEFKGFMLSGDLLSPERIGNLGYGDTYIAQQEELLNFDELGL